MNDEIIFFFGILSSGDVIELDSNDFFKNHQVIYGLQGSLSRETPAGFKIFEYSLFSKNSRINDRVIKWGNIKCELPEKDEWGSVNGGSHNGVIFKAILNDKFILTFNSANHSIEPIKQLMDILVSLKNHNVIVKT